jgi:hypothetical protein
MALIDSFLGKLLPVKTRNKLHLRNAIHGWNQSERQLTILREKNPESTPVPHIYKQNLIKEYAKRFNIKNFIETGTFLGIMMDSMKNEFDKLISIELSELLYTRAKELFVDQKNIEILLGNSADILPVALKNIDKPCLFWLDGHYSGGITAIADSETPILQELTIIFNHPVKNHVILIDDARLFTGERDYPTIAGLKTFLDKNLTNYYFGIKDDIIIIFIQNS